MVEQSIFFEEWRRCLREHYMYVIRTQDRVTEKTLVNVLHRVGFSDDELRELYMQATMRSEDVVGDFVPDMEKLPFRAHPAECACPACLEKALEIGHDAEGQPAAPEPVPLPEPEPAGNVFAAAKIEDSFGPEEITAEGPATDDNTPAKGKKKKKDTSKPKQMSMF